MVISCANSTFVLVCRTYKLLNSQPPFAIICDTGTSSKGNLELVFLYETHIQSEESFLRVKILLRPGLVGGFWGINRRP